MAKSKVAEAVGIFGRCLKEKRVKVSRTILFDSQIRGKAANESDVNLVIISDNFQGKNILERARMTEDAEIITIKKFTPPLDIMILISEEFERGTFLVAEYARKGKVMYAI